MTAAAERTENQLEAFFRTRVRALGGIVIKLSPIHRGTPDRLVLLPEGLKYLVELKTEVGRTSAAQDVWHDRARELGHPVVTLRGRADIIVWLRHRAREIDIRNGLESPASKECPCAETG
jgi:hypothetical protein